MRNLLFSVTSLFFVAFASAAHASPGYDFVCFDREMTATVSLDLEWKTAFLKNNAGEFELKAPEGQPDRAGYFDLSDGTYRFYGVAPEGQLSRGDQAVARCFQSRDSIKNIALYGAKTNGKWSKYKARGQGFQTVRSRPSVFGDKLASLSQGEPVIILENTDEFLDGFFWFKIEYGEGEQGYMWGALLCTDEDNPELNATLRKCG